MERHLASCWTLPEETTSTFGHRIDSEAVHKKFVSKDFGEFTIVRIAMIACLDMKILPLPLTPTASADPQNGSKLR
jgi:hypothetical protein